MQGTRVVIRRRREIGRWRHFIVIADLWRLEGRAAGERDREKKSET
jgi:hypothetical protein